MSRLNYFFNLTNLAYPLDVPKIDVFTLGFMYASHKLFLIVAYNFWNPVKCI